MKSKFPPTRSAAQTGFTLIELMFATLIFGMVLAVMLASFLQIGRLYYKGISLSTTDEAGQKISTDIDNDLRYSSSAACDNMSGQNCIDPANPYIHYFCIGNHRYTYLLSTAATGPYKIQAGDINSPDPSNAVGMIRDTVIGCPAPSTIAGTEPVQLLTINLQLNDLHFYCNDNSCYVHLHIVFYGADNSVFSSFEHPNDNTSDHLGALTDPDNKCDGSLLSTEFCAVNDITSLARLNG